MTPMEAGMQGGMQGAALGILMATGFVFLFIGALIYRYLKEKTAQARKLIFPLDPANDDLYAKALAEVKNDQAEQGLWARCLIGAKWG